MILIPIIGAISCFRNKKEYKEVNVFINYGRNLYKNKNL